VAGDTPEPVEGFETWLLRRVAQAVEAGEVSADLLAELQDESQAARERPSEEGHAAGIQHLADLAEVAEEEAAQTLATIEAQPSLVRELLMRRFVEAWLRGQRKAYRFPK
jgi:hypothetical protein